MSDEKSAASFKITIEGEGLKLDRAVSPDLARELINILMGGSASQSPGAGRKPPLQEGPGRAPHASGGRLSLREFLNEAEATNWPAKITAIGVYLHDHEGQGEFTRDDVRTRFRQAGEGQPGNYHRDFAVTIGNGWVAEDSRKPGTHYVTNTGRLAVERRFAGDVKRASAPARRRSAGATTGGDDGDADAS